MFISLVELLIYKVSPPLTLFATMMIGRSVPIMSTMPGHMEHGKSSRSIISITIDLTYLSRNLSVLHNFFVNLWPYYRQMDIRRIGIKIQILYYFVKVMAQEEPRPDTKDF